MNQFIEYRREFHHYPEIGCDTTQTLYSAEFDLDEDSISVAIEMLVHATTELHM